MAKPMGLACAPTQSLHCNLPATKGAACWLDEGFVADLEALIFIPFLHPSGEDPTHTQKRLGVLGPRVSIGAVVYLLFSPFLYL